MTFVEEISAGHLSSRRVRSERAVELLFSLLCLAQWRGGAVHEPGNSAETFPISPLVNYTPTLADRRIQQGRRSCGILCMLHLD